MSSITNKPQVAMPPNIVFIVFRTDTENNSMPEKVFLTRRAAEEFLKKMAYPLGGKVCPVSCSNEMKTRINHAVEGQTTHVEDGLIEVED